MQKISLHIEATSRCTLECPGCARTFLLDKFGKKSLPITDVNENVLHDFIDIDIDTICFSGVLGDPIYHPRFSSLLKVAKLKAEKVLIVTNGSHRPTNWWTEIVDILDEHDEVRFSIDGIPENFDQYRINGNWKSILNGINATVKGRPNTSWKYIPFAFNEENIDAAKQLSAELGIDNFFIYPSNRWEDLEHLRPQDSKLEDNNHARKDIYNNEHKISIDPICKNNSEHYISSAGFYSPCCYAADPRFYYRSQWWKNKEQHNIENTKLSNQLKMFNEFYKNINKNPTDYCMFNCGECKII